MISEKGPAFNSKILLFGEYSLMKGSMALCIPYEKFSGQLLFDKLSANKISNHASLIYLIEYLDFLKTNDLSRAINIEEFESDIESGLYFECNIPISYGLGSSGAIVAAIFDAYSVVGNINDLLELKILFAKMESYYHGESSGLDPLVSYLNKAVLISEDNKVKTVELPKEIKKDLGGIFLLDTKTTGETQPLVSWFLTEYENADFKNKIQNKLVPLNNKCISNYLSGDYDSLLAEIKSLSKFTIENFKPMIPSYIKEIWEKGIETNSYYLKLCGSGGGGMMLGFAYDLTKALNELSNFETHRLMSFKG